MELNEFTCVFIVLQLVDGKGLNAGTWEALASDRVTWKAEMHRALLVGEQHITLAAEVKRAKRNASCELSTTLHEARTVYLSELWPYLQI